MFRGRIFTREKLTIGQPMPAAPYINTDDVAGSIFAVLSHGVSQHASAKSFIEWAAPTFVPEIASGVYFSVGDEIATAGKIPVAVNPDALPRTLQMSEELGKHTLTIPIPPNGRLVLIDVPYQDVAVEKLASVGSMVAEMFDETRQDMLEHQRKAFVRVHGIAARMVSRSDEREVLRMGVEASADVVGFDACRIDYFDEDAEQFKLQVATEDVDDLPPLPSDIESAPRHAHQREKRIVIDDVCNYNIGTGAWGDYRSVLIVPIPDRGVFVGAGTGTAAFDTLQADMAHVLMTYVGQTIGRIRVETELRAANEHLEDQRERLEVLNRVVRHDIRNDMQLINGMANLVYEYVDEDTEAVRYLDRVTEGANSVVDLTQTLRELMEAMAERPNEVELSAVDIREMLQPEIEELQSTTDASVSADEVPSMAVRADNMLQSVFRNLLTNAVNHNDKDEPKVHVNITTDPEMVEVAIRDNGPGVDDDLKGEIFSKDIKGEDSTGTGIGLYLVKMLTDRYDGDVEVKDNFPEGAVFRVTLQRASPDEYEAG